MGFENSLNYRFYVTIGERLVINGVVYYLVHCRFDKNERKECWEVFVIPSLFECGLKCSGKQINGSSLV